MSTGGEQEAISSDLPPAPARSALGALFNALFVLGIVAALVLGIAEARH